MGVLGLALLAMQSGAQSYAKVKVYPALPAQSYIGTKVIQAERQERDGADGYKVVYPDGYESWSPKDILRKLTSRSTRI